MEIVYTKHASEMLALRKIRKTFVAKCVRKPDNILPAREGKKIYLKDFGTNYLKVVVAEEENSLVIITLHWLAKKRLKA